jgi:hypothetical protein
MPGRHGNRREIEYVLSSVLIRERSRKSRDGEMLDAPPDPSRARGNMLELTIDEVFGCPSNRG